MQDRTGSETDESYAAAAVTDVGTLGNYSAPASAVILSNIIAGELGSATAVRPSRSAG